MTLRLKLRQVMEFKARYQLTQKASLAEARYQRKSACYMCETTRHGVHSLGGCIRSSGFAGCIVEASLLGEIMVRCIEDVACSATFPTTCVLSRTAVLVQEI